MLLLIPVTIGLNVAAAIVAAAMAAAATVAAAMAAAATLTLAGIIIITTYSLWHIGHYF